MRSTPTAAIVLLLSFGAALADDTVLPPLRVPALFISPCGKPFRSVAGEPYPVGKWFAEADANHDGKLDQAEFRAEAAAFFQVLDTDHDGVIDDFEIGDYEKRLVPEILSPDLQGVNRTGLKGGAGTALGIQGNTPNGDIDQGGEVLKPPPQARLDDGGAKGAAEFGLLNDAEPVRSADRLFNSRITPEEFTAQADHNFDQLDVRKRGYLTLADLPMTPQQADLTRHFRQ